MFSGCHPRIIVPLAIPSLLGTYASASQAFESLNRAYESVESSDAIVIGKAQEIDAILLSLNGDFSHIVNYPPKSYKE
jgi:hypothetical protein